MDIPHITCRNCGIAKPWDSFTVPDGPSGGTILYACYDCYLRVTSEQAQEILRDTADDDRLRRNTYARAYYRRRTARKTRQPKKTPEQLLEARRRASHKQAEKMKEYVKLERIRKAIEMLESLGFKVT